MSTILDALLFNEDDCPEVVNSVTQRNNDALYSQDTENYRYQCSQTEGVPSTISTH